MSKGNNESKMKFVLVEGSSPKRWRSEAPVKEFGGSYLWLGHTAEGKMGDFFIRRGDEAEPMDGENGHITLLFRSPKATKEKDVYFTHSKFDIGGKSMVFFKNEDSSLVMMFKENKPYTGSASRPAARASERGGYNKPAAVAPARSSGGGYGAGRGGYGKR